MPHAKNISVRGYVSAGWLQNYFDTIQIPVTLEKRHVIDYNVKKNHKNIFSLKSTKNKNVQLLPEKQYFYKKRRVKYFIFTAI